MWILTWLLNEETEYKTFEIAFRALFEKIQECRVLTYQELETCIWIKTPIQSELPLTFYQCVEKAHKEGILKDGKLTPKVVHEPNKTSEKCS